MASQLHYPLPEAGWLWADKRILFDALILFDAFLIIGIFRRVTTFLYLYCLLCLTSAIYFFAGLAKLTLGPHYLSWLLENKLSNLFLSSYLYGWFGFLNQDTIIAITKTVSLFDAAFAAATLAIELS